MSAKMAKRSKVSVNNYISSEEEINSDLDSEQINEDLDDINAEDGSDSDERVGETAANPSWADAINKVLSIKTKNKSFILSKAKKDLDLKRKTNEEKDVLELVASDGTVVNSSDKNRKKLKSNESNEKKSKTKLKLSKNEWEVLNKLKPKAEDRDRERMLCSIATKGVVQLFNAVKEQQKTIENKINEIGSSETKRDKMLSKFNKNQFLDKLKQKDNSNKNKTIDSNQKQSEEQKWKVLSDDFMIGAKMKDWDKQTDSEQDEAD